MDQQFSLYVPPFNLMVFLSKMGTSRINGMTFTDLCALSTDSYYKGFYGTGAKAT